MNIRTFINKMLILNLAMALVVITSSACLDLTASSPANDSTIPFLVVTDFHSAVNSSDEDGSLSLFADNAIVLDNEQVIDGADAGREWSRHSQQMAGLHLDLIKSETNGDTLI